MKRITLSLLFVFVISQMAFSQVFLGGSLSYQHRNTEVSNNNSSTNIFEFSPILGYRTNKLDFGLLFIYQSEISSPSSNEMTNLGLGVFGGYKFLSIDRFSIAGRAIFHYVNSNQKNDNNTGAPYYYEYTINTKLHTIGINISPIFEFKLNNRFVLYTSIGSLFFSHSWGELIGNSSIVSIPKPDISTNSFGISLTTAVSLGFYIFFLWRKKCISKKG